MTEPTLEVKKKVYDAMRTVARNGFTASAPLVAEWAAALDPLPTMTADEAMQHVREEIAVYEEIYRRQGAKEPKWIVACRAIVAHYEAQPKAENQWPGLDASCQDGHPLIAYKSTRTAPDDCPVCDRPEPTRTGELVTEVTDTEHIIIGNMLRFFRWHRPESGFYYFVKDLAARCKVVRP